MTVRRTHLLSTWLCLVCAIALSGSQPAFGQETKTKAKAKATAKAETTKRVELNTATVEELKELPGVGEVTAAKIVAGRPYRSVDDLAKAGVSAREIEKLKGLVTVRRAAPAERPASEKRSAEKTTTEKRGDEKTVTEKRAAEKAAAERPAAERQGPVDLNTADVQEIETLPGIGPVLAAAIVKDRPYHSFADLERVKGMGQAKIAALNGRVKFGATAPPATEAAKPARRERKAVVDSSAPAEKSTAIEKPAPPPPASTTSPPARTRSATAKPAATKPAATKPAVLAPGQKVNINTASKDVLDALPGIGPVKAQGIIEGRPFRTIEDIKKVKGIKDFEFNAIKDIITVK